MFPVQNISELLATVVVKNLYPKLILQLNKDFLLANLDISFDSKISPTELKKQLNAALLDLITNNYDAYLNLVYRIDVSEKELLKIKSDELPVIEQLTFIVLKRVYQKVWFKNTL